MKARVGIFLFLLTAVVAGGEEAGAKFIIFDSVAYTGVEDEEALCSIHQYGTPVVVPDSADFYHTTGYWGETSFELFLPDSEFVLALDFRLRVPSLLSADTIVLTINGEHTSIFTGWWQHHKNSYLFLLSGADTSLPINIMLPSQKCVLTRVHIDEKAIFESSPSLEEFSAVDQFRSVRIQWQFSNLDGIISITILRGEDLSAPFHQVATIPATYSEWIDWNVEPGELYFYRLTWRDIYGNEYQSETDTPPFGSPKLVQDFVELVNITTLEGIYPEDISDRFQIPQFVSITDSVSGVSGEIRETEEGDIILEFQEGDHNIIFTSIGEHTDLFEWLVLRPLISSSECDVVWVKVNEKNVGLCIREYVRETAVFHDTSQLLYLFKSQLHQISPEEYYPNLTLNTERNKLKLQDIPFSCQVDLYYRVNEKMTEDFLLKLIETYNSDINLLRDGSCQFFEMDIHRDIIKDLRKTLFAWEDELQDVFYVLGDIQTLRITEFVPPTRGDSGWVELMVMGEGTIHTADYCLKVGESDCFYLPDAEMPVGEVILSPIPENILLDSTKYGTLIYLFSRDSDIPADSLWFPPLNLEGSIGRQLNGELVYHPEPTPGLCEISSSQNQIIINEFSLSLEDTEDISYQDEGQINLDVELYLLDIESVSITDLRLVMDFHEENPIWVDQLEWIEQFYTLSLPIVFPPRGNHLLQLQRLDPNDGWVNDQIIWLNSSREGHWSRIPDGGKWQVSEERTLGESNLLLIREMESLLVPEVFVLYQNHPNPFNMSTTIHFDLLQGGIVTLIVVDAAGREVSTLIQEEEMTPGHYRFLWEGDHIGSGIYFFTLRVLLNDLNFFVDSRKMVYLK